MDPTHTGAALRTNLACSERSLFVIIVNFITSVSLILNVFKARSLIIDLFQTVSDYWEIISSDVEQLKKAEKKTNTLLEASMK